MYLHSFKAIIYLQIHLLIHSFTRFNSNGSVERLTASLSPIHFLCMCKREKKEERKVKKKSKATLRGGPLCLVIKEHFTISLGNCWGQCSPKKTHISRRRGYVRLEENRCGSVNKQLYFCTRPHPKEEDNIITPPQHCVNHLKGHRGGHCY